MSLLRRCAVVTVVGTLATGACGTSTSSDGGGSGGGGGSSSSGNTPDSFTLEHTHCGIQASGARVGGEDPQWIGCRIWWSSADDVYTVQLMRANTSGSFPQPGAGWLTLNLAGATEPHSSVRADPAKGSGAISGGLDAGTTYVAYVTTGGDLVKGTGTVQIGGKGNDPYQQSVYLELGLDGLQLGAVAASGSVTIQASPTFGGTPSGGGSAGGGGGGGGGGSCSDNGASCATDPGVRTWNQICQGNSAAFQLVQASCHCAAALVAQCFIEHGCFKEAGANTTVTEQQLKDIISNSVTEAGKLGTNCSRPP